MAENINAIFWWSLLGVFIYTVIYMGVIFYGIWQDKDRPRRPTMRQRLRGKIKPTRFTNQH